MNIPTYAFVALGGATGAVTRFLLSTWVNNKFEALFPWGTFFVNITGCFLLGFIYILGIETLLLPPNLRTFLTVGFLGAFTTFSTYNLETISLLKSGEVKLAIFNGLGSLLAGLLAVWVGTLLAKIITQ